LKQVVVVIFTTVNCRSKEGNSLRSVIYSSIISIARKAWFGLCRLSGEADYVTQLPSLSKGCSESNSLFFVPSKDLEGNIHCALCQFVSICVCHILTSFPAKLNNFSWYWPSHLIVSNISIIIIRLIYICSTTSGIPNTLNCSS